MLALDHFDPVPFPVDRLPLVLREWCEAEAQAIQVPSDLPALASLCVGAGSLAGGG